MDFTRNSNICFSLTIVRLILGVLMASFSQAQTRILSGTSSSSAYQQQFEQWMARHGRVYENPFEKEMRFRISRENVARIDEFNREANMTYDLGINQFADLTNNKEFKARNIYKVQRFSDQTGIRYNNVSSVPSSVDWREKGAVTPIKDQGQCGSGSAFSAVAAIEGIHQITTGKLLSLSEQEIIDCDATSPNQGCSGGLMDMDDAFKFVERNRGITTEANYPYQGSSGACNKQKEADHAAKITGHEDVPANSEVALLRAAANQPVSVTIDAGSFEFQFYKSGIFTGPCGTELDHGVAVVGYGEISDGIKYWIVKNSWGSGWGEEGYIRMQRDVAAEEGLCGIAMKASYPTA